MVNLRVFWAVEEGFVDRVLIFWVFLWRFVNEGWGTLVNGSVYSWVDAMEFKGVGLAESLRQALGRSLGRLQSPVVFGAWLTTAITVLGIGYVVLAPKPSRSQGMNEPRSIVALAKLGYCPTIVTDPNPPLNVRSSPVVAPGNIVGSLKNGVELTVINESQSWLQVSAPIRGWIYEPLTVTVCNPNLKK